MAPALTDLDLLRRYIDTDDADAFAGLVRRHAPLVFHTCLRVLGDRDRAEDATQETFHRLMGHPEKVNHSLAAWLHRVATRCAIDILRSDTARRKRELAYQQRVDRRRTPAEPWSSLSAQLDEALTKLNPAQRALLVEHFLNGKTQAQLAGEAGVSKATLSRRMEAALATLRTRMGRTTGIGAAGLAVALAGLPASASAGVPASLTAELNKMAMLSGTTVGPTGVVVQIGSMTFKLSTVIAGGVTAACASLGLAFYLLTALVSLSPPDSGNREAVESVRAAVIDPAEAASPLTASELVYVRRPGDSLRSDHVLAYSIDDGYANVVFADSHTRLMSLEEARSLIEPQTGLTLEQLAARTDSQP